MKKIIAKIDGKNVGTDWLEDVFDDYDIIRTQKGNIHRICGYIEGELVECTYQFGDNEMNWYIYTLYSRLDDVKESLKDRLAKYETDERELYSEIKEHESYLTQNLYFKED